ncbi:MAG: hypothetical protein WC541_02075 [Dehalococcoidia bacterium]
MENDLHTAFLNKERAELFLTNLEKLRSDKAINELSYTALKTEYSVNLQHAQIKIDQIKQEFSKRLALRSRQLGVFKQEMANLDARFKVGQMPAEEYLKQIKNPQKKVAALEDQIAHLTSLTEAKSSAEISVPESTGLASLFSSRMRQGNRQPVIMPDLTWTPPPPPAEPDPPEAVPPPEIPDPTSITSLHILPDRAYPGSSIGVIATVINSGIEKVRHRAEFKINGRLEATNEISIEPGLSHEVTFMTVGGAPGDYTISVDKASGILKIMPPA